MPPATLDFIAQREAVYERLFGPYALVYDDANPISVPHIDVYVHEPGHGGRDYYTLVTGGMSDRAMPVPADAPPELPRRTELVFYLPGDEAPRREFVAFLRQAARFVYDFDTWLTWGHTIPNGDPPQPIFAGSQFVSMLFLFPLIEPDRALADHLVLQGDPVGFLWPIPLTAAEQNYVHQFGTRALEEKFNEARLPFVFDEHRRSCV